MSAHGAGKAYAIGLMLGLMQKGLTYDEAKWVTLHPAGKGPKASELNTYAKTKKIKAV